MADQDICNLRESISQIVILDYNDLSSPGSFLGEQISAAFGSDGLGLLCVRGVPGYVRARSRLLPLAQKFAVLDDTVKEKYVHTESCYSFGWSHGKEKLQGRPDLSKGSYYANPQYDRPVDDIAIIDAYPTFVHPNIWPTNDLPDLEPSFKELGQMIVTVGILVARHCDTYVHSLCPTYTRNKLERIITESKCCKGRLLHYFSNQSIRTTAASITNSHEEALEPSDIPASKPSPDHGVVGSAGDDDFSSWCGWHNDHGSLTGLTAAIYLNEIGEVVEGTDSSSGLYVRNRKSELIKIAIPPDCIAFQIGETAQIHSGGLLQATPHAVRGSKLSSMEGITRETFGVFMEPMWDCPMSVPPGIDPTQAQSNDAAKNLPPGVSPISSRWTLGQDFGAFTKKSLEIYY